MPDIFETNQHTELERRLSGRIYLLDICLRQLVRDMDILQERMDKLDGLMSMIRLRLPVMVTVQGRNKLTEILIPPALDTLD